MTVNVNATLSGVACILNLFARVRFGNSAAVFVTHKYLLKNKLFCIQSIKQMRCILYPHLTQIVYPNFYRHHIFLAIA